jgi:hypothetical protein
MARQPADYTKPKSAAVSAHIACLRCAETFLSANRKTNRVCQPCTDDPDDVDERSTYGRFNSTVQLDPLDVPRMGPMITTNGGRRCPSHLASN